MELKLPIERPQYNPTNGQFLKGHIPHNKGKKASEYMSKEGLEKILRIGRKNLKPNHQLGGHNKRAVIAVYEGKVVGWFCSVEEAGRRTGITPSAIRRVCYGKRKSAGGFNWQYD